MAPVAAGVPGAAPLGEELADGEAAPHATTRVAASSRTGRRRIRRTSGWRDASPPTTATPLRFHVSGSPPGPAGATPRAGPRSRYHRRMRLIPWEEERLQLFAAAELARRRRASGLLLNHPEAVAIICDAMLEAARAGTALRGGRGGRARGRRAGRRCCPACASSSTRCASRCCSATGPASSRSWTRSTVASLRDPFGPGALVIGDPADVVVNEGRDAIELEVTSTSRRRIRVSSHFPFHRLNQRLVFDREAARGFRLDIPAGGYVGWEPGETKTVRLVRLAGRQACDGPMRVRPRDEPPLRRGVPHPLRRHDRRPGPPRRHGPLGPRAGGPHRAGRRAGLGLREEPADANRAGRHGGRAVGTRHRAHRRARHRPGPRRRQGRHRHQGRPHRRHRPGAAAPRSATASTSSSGRTPSRTWPTG